MSMRLATRVDVGRPPSAATVPGEIDMHPRKDSTAMTPIAAYYVMVASEHEREMRPRHESIVPRPSLASRIVSALETLVRLGRPATTQPI
jgi:hypothetical protein